MSGFIGMPTLEDIKRINAELARIRWYLGRLGESMGGGHAVQIAEALKTGDASTAALRPIVDAAHLDSMPSNRWTEDQEAS